MRHARRRIDACHTRQGGGPGVAQQQLLPPGIELPAADAVLASHHRCRHPRLHPFGHDLTLLLDHPTTALAAGARLGIRASSTRTIHRKSIPCLRSALRHAVLFRNRRHLAPNGTRRATCCRDVAYENTGLRSSVASPEIAAVCRQGGQRPGIYAGSLPRVRSGGRVTSAHPRGRLFQNFRNTQAPLG